MKKILLLAVTGIFWFALYLYIPFLTPYLIALGVTATLAGVIFAAHSFVQVLLRFPLGIRSDALGRQKPFIILGMVFVVISSLIMRFFPSPAMLFVGNAVSGFASTMYVSYTVLYARYYEKTETSKAMGVIGGMSEVGILAAFLLGGFLYQQDGIKILFTVSAVAAAGGLVLSLFVREKPAPKEAVRTQDILEVIRNKQLLVSSVLGILIKALVFATAFSFTPKMAQDIGANGTQIGVISALFIGASVIGSFFVATKAGMKIGYRKISVTGFVLLGANAALIPFIHSIPLFMAVQFLGGLGYASLTSIFMTNAVKDFGQDKKPIAMGFYQAAYSAGSTLGPVLMGIFADAFHYTAAYLIIATIAVAGIAIVLVGYRRKPQQGTVSA